MPQRWVRIAVVGLLASLGALAALTAAAEIYKWTDDSGKLHFAQNLSQVPPHFRAQAMRNAEAPEQRSRVQTFHPISPASPAPRAHATATGSGERSYEIPVEKAGNMLKVMVRLNDRFEAPFYIDTGASDVAVPRWMIEKLGLDLSEARTARYGTANGTIEAALITLDSVELGGARVEGVPASVSDSMQVGLLGLSFFNHFRYNVDPVRGIVTLTENGLAEQGLIRGGRSASQWRGEFARMQDRIAAAEHEKDYTPRSHGREHKRLDQVLAELQRQYEVLEDEADEARVPFSWRD